MITEKWMSSRNMCRLKLTELSVGLDVVSERGGVRNDYPQAIQTNQ